MSHKPETVDVLVAQISQQFNLPHAVQRADLKAALAHHPHFANVTEVGENDDLANAQAVAHQAGYRFYGGKSWDCAVLVREDVEHIDAGYRFVHRGRSGRLPGREGGYYPRGITWARGLVDGRDDLDIWFGGGHPVTRQGGIGTRMEHRQTFAEAFAEELESNSVRSRIAIGAMDANEDDEPGTRRPTARVFEGAGCATIWDDLKTYPPTLDGHRSTIDWLLRNRNDQRASWRSVRVFEQRHVDHDMILGTLRVELKPDKVVEQHACPTCGAVHDIA